MVYPTSKPDPNEKSYTVYERRGDVIVRIGIVRATDQVLADTKARRLYHQNTWTKEVEHA